MRENLDGRTVTLKDGFKDPYAGNVEAGTEYRVEGYWDTITGKSWMFSDGNPAALNYAVRSGIAGLPLDNNVLYGKIGSLGFLVHISEVVV